MGTKKSHGLRSGEYGGCGTKGMPFLAKNLITEIAMWQGALLCWSIQLSPMLGRTQTTLFLSLKNLTVITLINSLSLRHKFYVDNPLTVKKADELGFGFWLAHSCFFQTWWCRCVPFLTLSFCFWIVLKDPCFLTCKHVLQKISVTLDPFQKMKTYVLPIVLLFDCQVFGKSSHTIFSWLIHVLKSGGLWCGSNLTC